MSLSRLDEYPSWHELDWTSLSREVDDLKAEQYRITLSSDRLGALHDEREAVRSRIADDEQRRNGLFTQSRKLDDRPAALHRPVGRGCSSVERRGRGVQGGSAGRGHWQARRGKKSGCSWGSPAASIGSRRPLAPSSGDDAAEPLNVVRHWGSKSSRRWERSVRHSPGDDRVGRQPGLGRRVSPAPRPRGQ